MSAAPITNPDITNEDPQYWEEVLATHGLGLIPQAGDNDDGDDEEEEVCSERQQD